MFRTEYFAQAQSPYGSSEELDPIDVTQHDAEKAEAVFAMDDRIVAQGHSASRHQSRRLVVHEPNRLPAYSVEVDALENLKRIHHFARRMARTLRPPETGSPDEA